MKFQQSIFKELIDSETGEIKQVESTKIWTHKIQSPKNFYQVFAGFAAAQRNIKSAKTIHLLSELCELANYNDGKVELTPSKRDYLCKTIEFDKAALSKALKQLVALNILSGKRSEYIINPEFAWKGDLTTRDKFLQDKEIQITFSIKTD